MALIDPDWRDLSSYKRDLLVALAADGPATGVTLHERVRADAAKNPARTYSHLTDLVDMGLVRREDSETDGRERVNHLTDDGRDLVERGVAEPSKRIVGALYGQ